MHISQITGIRFNDSIDVFVTQKNGCLKHYYANASSNWISQSRVLSESDCIGKPAAIRFQNQIDVYVLTRDGLLLHFWWSSDLNLKLFKSEILAHNLSCPPVVTRWENEIDIFYFNNEIHLCHLRTSDKTNWIYEKETLDKATINFGLTTSRTQENLIDIFFISQNKISHLSGTKLQDGHIWKYETNVILPDIYVSLGSIQVTRSFDTLNLFYCNENNQICQAICGSYTNGKYLNIGPIPNLPLPKLNEFSVVEFEKNIDIYCIGTDDNCVHHRYFGPYSNFKWESDEIISNSNAGTPLIAMRPYKKAIDVYYLDKNEDLIHLFIGESTGNNWDAYQTDSELPIIDWNDLNLSSANLIHEGCQSLIYLIDKMIIKKFKTPNPAAIRKEATILEKISKTIWNKYFKAYVFENDRLVGLAMFYYQGEKLDLILEEKENIFTKSSSARIKLIKMISQRIHGLQRLGICHGDLNPSNIIIIKQKDETNIIDDLIIIDFSSAIFFNINSIEFSLIRINQQVPFRFILSPEFKTGLPFDPSGTNAYQLAKLCMQIQSSFENNKEIDIIANGLDSDICKRNKIFDDFRNLPDAV